MPNTPNHAFPSPADEDWVSQAPYDFQQLAARMDDVTDYNAGVTILPGEAAGVVAAGGAATLVDFPGQAGLDEFTYDAGVLTYAGPTRMFLVSAAVQVKTSTEDAAMVWSAVTLRHNNIEMMGSYDSLGTLDADNTTGTIAERSVMHTITVPVVLSTGQNVNAIAQASHASTLGITALRIYPLGPRP